MGYMTQGRLTLSPKELAKMLGVSEKTLWTRTQEGCLPVIRLGRRVLYPVNEIEEWIKKEAAKGKAEESANKRRKSED